MSKLLKQAFPNVGTAVAHSYVALHSTLRGLGVPTELVVFEGEGHAISRPEHVRDLQERMVAWFDRYLAR